MRIGIYAHWNVSWDGHTLWTLGCHARYLREYLELTDGVRLFSTVWPGPRERNTDGISDPRLEVVKLPGNSFRTTWPRQRKIRKIVAKNLDGLDAVVARLFDACAWILVPPCEQRGIGLVFHLVGDPVEDFRQRRDLFCLNRWLQRLAFLPEEVLVFRAIKSHTLLINGRQCTRIYGPRHPDPKTVITSTLHEEELYQREDTCTGETCVVLYTGMIRPGKSLETLIDAVGQLVGEGRSVRLRLVGYTEPPSYLDALRGRVRKAKLEGCVEFTGYVPLGDPLNAEYRAADIYAFPSLHEGSARTLLEAASQSLPCVITDVGSARDLFAEGESALIVPTRDPAAMARAIARFMDEPELRRRCIRNAYAVAAERTCGKFIRQVVEHLREAHQRARRVGDQT